MKKIPHLSREFERSQLGECKGWGQLPIRLTRRTQREIEKPICPQAAVGSWRTVMVVGGGEGFPSALEKALPSKVIKVAHSSGTGPMIQTGLSPGEFPIFIWKCCKITDRCPAGWGYPTRGCVTGFGGRAPIPQWTFAKNWNCAQGRKARNKPGWWQLQIRREYGAKKNAKKRTPETGGEFFSKKCITPCQKLGLRNTPVSWEESRVDSAHSRRSEGPGSASMVG